MKSLILCAFFCGLSFATPAKIFHNGTVHVLGQNDSVAQWISISAGKVTGYGTGNTYRAGPDTTLVDLKGRTLLPGLTDAHAHLSLMGENLSQLELRGTKSVDEAVGLLKAYLSKQKGRGTVVGNNWDQSDWPGKAYPDRKSLDAVAPNTPIILYRVDGHAAWVNTVALKRSGLWKVKEDPKGGKIERDASGAPTGILIDTAMDPLGKLVPSPSVAKIESYLRLAVDEAVRHGVTSVHDAGVSGKTLTAIKNLLKKKKVKFRFYEFLSAEDMGELRGLMKKGVEVGSFDDQLTVRAVKLYQDGAMGSRGAAFAEPYDDDPKNKGLLRHDAATLTALVKEIDAAGFQVATHAIGSLANETVLDAYEKALGEKIAEKRPRLEHAQVLTERDVARAAKLGVIASMQPTHCTSDMKWVVARIGEKRARFAYAWKSVLDAKGKLAFGSDAPVESINPWEGLYSAVMRQTAKHEPPGGFFPEQRLTFKDALAAFTTGAAVASFQETTAGTLELGRRADFIVVPKDPFTLYPDELRELQVDETYIGGERVYGRTVDAKS